METKDIPKQPASLWVPESDLETLAIVGKLAEECNELAGRCARVVIQGLFEKDPDSGKLNIEHAMEEIADVEAVIMHFKRRLLDSLPEGEATIVERRNKKYDYKKPWLDFLSKKMIPF